MPSHLILWPMLVVLAIPFFVLFLNGKRKAVDRREGNLQADAPINNTAWSLPVVLTSNSLANQFQLPVVFYVLCIVLIHLNGVSLIVLGLCWLFAITRWLHAIVHVTSNAIPLRLSTFLVSTLTLLMLFAITIFTLAQYNI